MSVRRARLARWLTLLVTVGLLAMHGAAGAHGVGRTGMAMVPTTVTTNPSAGQSVSVHIELRLPRASALMTAHAGEFCVALPVLSLIIAMAATLVRRRDRLSRPWSTVRMHTARAPPCPSPQTRGVCLT